MAEAAKKYAVVTGANKGIGFEICKQLISQGVTVVLTARDEKRGLEALEKLKTQSHSRPIFHRLDVMDSQSVASLAQFLKSRFGRLDILVNNAGIRGAIVNADAFRAAFLGGGGGNWNAIATETHDLAVEAFETNYYGVKRTTEAFLPLLQSSPSPRIVNISSSMGKLKNIKNEWAKGMLGDAESVTEERIDKVVNEFLKDLKEEDSLIIEAKGWPQFLGAYTVSKAAVNAYTRILARKYGDFRINCVCPGFVATDINFNTGVLTIEQGGEGPVRLALLPDDGPSGLFFYQKQVTSFE